MNLKWTTKEYNSKSMNLKWTTKERIEQEYFKPQKNYQSQTIWTNNLNKNNRNTVKLEWIFEENNRNTVNLKWAEENNRTETGRNTNTVHFIPTWIVLQLNSAVRKQQEWNRQKHKYCPFHSNMNSFVVK